MTSFYPESNQQKLDIIISSIDSSRNATNINQDMGFTNRLTTNQTSRPHTSEMSVDTQIPMAIPERNMKIIGFSGTVAYFVQQNNKQPIGPVNHHGKSHENHENRIFFIYVLISQSASPKSPTLYHLYIS